MTATEVFVSIFDMCASRRFQWRHFCLTDFEVIIENAITETFICVLSVFEIFSKYTSPSLITENVLNMEFEF